LHLTLHGKIIAALARVTETRGLVERGQSWATHESIVGSLRASWKSFSWQEMTWPEKEVDVLFNYFWYSGEAVTGNSLFLMNSKKDLKEKKG